MDEQAHIIRNGLVEALSSSELLKMVGKNAADKSQFRRMLEHSEVLTFRRGTTIIRQGQRSDRMFFLINGTVKVTKDAKTICTLSQVGDVFGEMGVITGKARSASVVALTKVSCVVTESGFAQKLGAEDYQGLMDSFQHAMVTLLLSRMQETNEDLSQTRTALEGARDQVRILNTRLEAKEAEIRELRSQLKKNLGWAHRQETDR